MHVGLRYANPTYKTGVSGNALHMKQIIKYYIQSQVVNLL